MYLHYLWIMMPAIVVTLYGYHKTRNDYYSAKVTNKEMMISLTANFISGIVMIIFLHIYIYGQVHDNYTLNGKVTGKHKDTVSCEHSYQTCTTSNKVTTCTTHYEHWNDYDWVVDTTLDSVRVGRVDRQGNDEPPRFTKVIIGEPASRSYNFNNYLLADKDSLFLQNASVPSKIPQPAIYDYYRVDHVVGEVELPEVESTLDVLLQGKRFNVKVVTVVDKPIEYFYSVMMSWLGGKINDVIIVVNLDKDNKVVWVKVNTYAKGYKNQMMIKELESLTLGKVYDKTLVSGQVSLITKEIIILPESEFEEKLDMVEIPTGLLVLMIIINLLISIGIHVKMTKEDL